MARKGFTLAELSIVTLLIGVLAAFAVPQYLKTVESSKAESAAGLVSMVGTTNRMFALDHGGQYASGSAFNNACNDLGVPCPAAFTSPVDRCNLVRCRYLAADEWANKPYLVAAVDPASGVCPINSAGTNLVACAVRRDGSGIYANWGYGMQADGTMVCFPGGTASACGVVDGPPKPER
ncbi:MAG: prepilin-type N-terminal cleavage/methylation domain-containing protein [Elusimicrobia bacterium]|nr:prepilin-type N-terminal cleavage/methylation domain-containing protein [Elusimicrobiota bacterium]